jgi:hypothetical protein
MRDEPGAVIVSIQAMAASRPGTPTKHGLYRG